MDSGDVAHHLGHRTDEGCDIPLSFMPRRAVSPGVGAPCQRSRLLDFMSWGPEFALCRGVHSLAARAWKGRRKMVISRGFEA